jgi:hypothetical protein
MWVGLVGVCGVAQAWTQQAGGDGKTTPPVLLSGQTTITEDSGAAKAPADTLLTPQQELELRGDEDSILQFVSHDTGLAIKKPVKLRFVSREEVNKELRKKFDEDKGAKRMERSELVMKKFGLLDPDFKMRPFLLSLLTEQIAGFYDNKTKEMNLLNWVPIDQQKPVMAHELTHALQDQRVNLTKWGDQEVEGVAKDVAEDNHHIATDETDTAREAALEGQAMVTFADHMLVDTGHTGKTIKNFPQVVDMLVNGAGDASDSPVLARAPLVLQQALLFPYTAGLKFEDVVLTKQGTEKAFAGVLDAPPNSSFEVMTPDAYLQHASVPVLRLPDIHPLLKSAGFEPYDVGVMGELDVRMTAELFGGKPLAEALAPNWSGGVYYAAQRSSATPEQKSTSASLGLLYLSQWKNDDSARSYFDVFDQQMARQYDSLKRRNKDEQGDNERVYSTNEGDVLLIRDGKSVWVSEGFDLALARKLYEAVSGANPIGQGKLLSASNRAPGGDAAAGFIVPQHGLIGGLVGTLGSFGVLRAVLPRR